MYNLKIVEGLRNYFWSREAKTHILWACVPLCNQQIKRKCRIILSSLPYPSIISSHIISYKTNYRKDIFENKYCVWFYEKLRSEMFLFLRRFWIIVLLSVWLSNYYSKQNLTKENFLQSVSKYQFLENPSRGSWFIQFQRTDGRRSIMKLIFTIWKFTKQIRDFTL